ncbi:MAG: 6-phosphofructokinase [Chloroflexota bacterium]
MMGRLVGKALVGQSGGATAVINSSLVGVVQEAMGQDCIDGVYGMRYGIQGLLSEQLVDFTGVDAATIAAMRQVPSAGLGTCRYKLRPGDTERVVEICRQWGVRYFFYIGGNDSADTSHRIAQAAQAAGYDLRVVGVPKTIDNDLPLTDHCPGYGSIARFVAAATLDAGRDTEANRYVDPVKIVEVMGRNAGWVAAATALGRHAAEDAPHLIYFPERPLSVERLLDDVHEVHERLGFCVVAITETMRDEAGRPLAEEGHETSDAFGHRRLAGAANRLANLISERLGVRARWDKPGTIQRSLMALASQVDLDEAYLVGQMAVRYAVEGRHDSMVVLVRDNTEEYRCTTNTAPLVEIANREKKLPPEYINAAGNHVTPAFLDYARPLIGSPLPAHPRLK